MAYMNENYEKAWEGLRRYDLTPRMNPINGASWYSNGVVQILSPNGDISWLRDMQLVCWTQSLSKQKSQNEPICSKVEHTSSTTTPLFEFSLGMRMRI